MGAGDFDSLYRRGLGRLQEGRAQSALSLLDQALALRPKDAGALILSGLALQSLGMADAALARFDQVLADEPGNPAALCNRGMALEGLGRLEEALASFESALALRPDMIPALNNRANILLALERRQEALTAFDRLLAREPGFAAALHNRAITLRELGRCEEALVSHDAALKREPANAAMLHGRGVTLAALGRMEQAAAAHQKAVARDSQLTEAWTCLGNALLALGRGEDAKTAWRRAMALGDNLAAENLALLLTDEGRAREALTVLKPLLGLEPPSAVSANAGKIFAAAMQQMVFAEGDEDFVPLLTRALNESWTRPSELAPAAARLLRPRLPAAEDGEALGRDGLLMALLVAAPNEDAALEDFLVRARRAVLARAERGEDGGLDFACALARQCFINDHAWMCDVEELRRAAALAQDTPLRIAAAAAYALLHSEPTEAMPDCAEALVNEQLREPAQETRLMAEIPRLTAIADSVSQAVRAQYEDHPYPRWVKSPPVAPDNLGAYLARKFPLAPFRRDIAVADILVAGCGTGQHAIATARKFRGARVLAIDLSLASLAYAVRKSHELDVKNVDYAQADLLALPALGRRFDAIEAVGVLHHLADPFAGWQALLSCLKPGGVMMLGFYSALARPDVVRARAFIAARGYRADDDGIRRCRRDILDSGDFPALLESPDFWSLSGCRDLLFHVQEHRLALDEIAGFIAANNLTFIGFEISGAVLAAYRRRFPQDEEATDLANWRAFETDHPGTFAGMYQFWIQNAAPQSGSANT